MKHKLLIVLMLWLTVAGNVFGYDKYGVVQTQTEGTGYVYASTDEQELDEITGWTNSTNLWSQQPSDSTVYWVYAKPNMGFKFAKWSDDSTDAKHKVYYNRSTMTATFEMLDGWYKLYNVPYSGKVYLNDTLLTRITDGNSNYYYAIRNGAKVRIDFAEATFSDVMLKYDLDIENFPLESETAWKEGKQSITFTMPKYNTNMTFGKMYINNTQAWQEFKDMIADGVDFTDHEVVLTDDISTNVSVGENLYKCFKGIFNGNGHVLEFTAYNSLSGEYYIAPFRYAENATIKDLTITGTTYSAGRYSAGLVGYATNTTIDSCVVTSTIKQYQDYIGGIVGTTETNTNLTIRNSVFAGTINCSADEPANHVGGIVGLNHAENIIMQNCLDCGKYINVTSWYPMGELNLDSYTITNCYYTDNKGPETDNAYGAQPACKIVGSEGISIALANDNEHGISYGDTIYAANGEEVKLIISNDSKKSYKVNHGTLSSNSDGSYTLTMPEDNASYETIVVSIEDFVLNQDSSTYVINTAKGWDIFCDLLADNEKGYFTNKTVVLDADISVTRMAGGSQHDFTGTFDGGNHTLTVTYGSASEPIDEDKAAPFRNVESGCVIKDLHVTGDIYTSKKYAGGLVGTQYGTVKIENCRVSTVIHSYTSGDGTHGGLVGLNGSSSASNLTIDSCVFNGKLLTCGETATTDCAGFVGWKNNTVTITNSLYAPADLNMGETEVATGATFVRNGSVGSKCFYTRPLGTEQGEPTVTYIDADGVEQICTNYTLLTGEISGFKTAGWYVVRDAASCTNLQLTCQSSDMHIILCDGAKLSVSGSDAVPIGQSNLFIYAQSTGDNMGQIESSDYIFSVGDITICGGKININSKTKALMPYNDLIIYGGQITAEGESYGIRTNDVTLGLRSATDFIKASDYCVENVCIANGQTLYDELGNTYSGTLTEDEINAIAGKTLKLLPYITLANDADNSTVISNCEEKIAKVTLQGRTLYKDGNWNTLCLPFDVDLTDENCPLYGATAKTLSSASITENATGETLHLTFGSAVETLEAGVPYIIRWEKANDYVDDDEHNIVNPVFSGVTITAAVAGNSTFTSGDYKVSFLGTYSPATLAANTTANLFLGAANKLHYPTQEGYKVNACRAYFTIDNTSLNAKAFTDFVIDFGDGEATSVHSVEFIMQDCEAGAWYSIDGRPLTHKPAAKGVYIHGGKKVVIP